MEKASTDPESHFSRLSGHQQELEAIRVKMDKFLKKANETDKEKQLYGESMCVRVREAHAEYLAVMGRIEAKLSALTPEVESIKQQREQQAQKLQQQQQERQQQEAERLLAETLAAEEAKRKEEEEAKRRLEAEERAKKAAEEEKAKAAASAASAAVQDDEPPLPSVALSSPARMEVDEADLEETFEVSVKFLSGKILKEVVKKGMLVGAFKSLLFERDPTLAATLKRLIVHGKALDEDKSLIASGVKEGVPIFALIDNSKGKKGSPSGSPIAEAVRGDGDCSAAWSDMTSHGMK